MSSAGYTPLNDTDTDEPKQEQGIKVYVSYILLGKFEGCFFFPESQYKKISVNISNFEFVIKHVAWEIYMLMLMLLCSALTK